MPEKTLTFTHRYSHQKMQLDDNCTLTFTMWTSAFRKPLSHGLFTVGNDSVAVFYNNDIPISQNRIKHLRGRTFRDILVSHVAEDTQYREL